MTHNNTTLKSTSTAIDIELEAGNIWNQLTAPVHTAHKDTRTWVEMDRSDLIEDQVLCDCFCFNWSNTLYTYMNIKDTHKHKYSAQTKIMKIQCHKFACNISIIQGQRSQQTLYRYAINMLQKYHTFYIICIQRKNIGLQ